MSDTVINTLVTDIANAVTVKLAALGANLAVNEKTAVDWGALATQAKNAITSPEMGNILRQANQRGLRLGTMAGVVNGVKGGINGAVQGYRNAGPGAWNKIKGTMGGSLKGQLTGTVKGFGGGYATGAGSSIVGDAITGTKDMQALKGMFNGSTGSAIPSRQDQLFRGQFSWSKLPSQEEVNTLNDMLNNSVM